MRDRQNKWRLRPINAVAYICIALTYHLVFLTYAYQYGWLAGLIPWDDCAFLARGLHNAHLFLTSKSIINFILRNDLKFHAPLAGIQTLAGLLLFNFNFFLTYLLAFVHTVALLLFLDYYFRNSTRFLKYCIILLALSLPIVQSFPAELKSDMKGGMYLMMALLLLFEFDSDGLNWQRAAVIYAAITLSTLAKVTAFYMPLYCLGILGLYWLVHIYCAKKFYEGKDLQPGAIIFKRCLIIFAAYMCTYLLVVLPNIKQYLEYIKYALSNKWVDEFSLAKHLLYYTPFVSSKAWSRYWYLLLLLLPLALLQSFKTNKSIFLRHLSLFFATAVLLLPLLISKTHGITFGAYFYFAVFGCFLMTVRFLEESFSLKPVAANSYTAILCFAIIACVLFQPKFKRFSYPMEINVKRNEIVSKIAGQIHENSVGRNVAFLFDNLLIPYPNLYIRYYQMYHKFLNIDRIDSFQEINKGADMADYVLAVDNPEAKYLLRRKAWTSNQRAREVLDIIKHRKDFRLIGKYGLWNFNIYLFIKKK